MANFVLIVDLEIRPECIDAFLSAAKQQAEHSIRLEPGCVRFDIIQRAGEANKVTHYEIFEDQAAFEAHAAMPHTASFSKIIEPLIINADVRRGQLRMSLDK